MRGGGGLGRKDLSLLIVNLLIVKHTHTHTHTPGQGFSGAVQHCHEMPQSSK